MSTETGAGIPTFALTDLGNAKRLVHHFGDKILYCGDMGVWYYWDTFGWNLDRDGSIERYAKEVAEDMIVAEANSTKDPNLRIEYFKWAKQSQQRSKIKNMIDLAQTETKVVAMSWQLDGDGLLLNVRNGTIDLKTGELRDHDPTDRITKLANVDFDSEAKCPKWLEFVEQIMDGDDEKVTMLQQLAGASLTGNQLTGLIYCYGTGANGKTTFLETLKSLLGDYAQKAPRGMLEEKRSSAIPNDLARLRGARLVVSNELSSRRSLDAATIKDLTGGDTISARFLHKEFFEFKPTHVLWVYGNHLPMIDELDEGVWRRFQIMPFTVAIPKADQRGELAAELLGESPGILNWALKGLHDALANGRVIKVAKSVKIATEEYREEMDQVGRFLLDECERKTSYTVDIRDLYMAYESWCNENREQPLSKIRFGWKLQESGFRKDRINKVRYWKGIRLSPQLSSIDGSLTDTSMHPPSQGIPPGMALVQNDQGEWEIVPEES